MDLQINPSFRDLIPTLSADEYSRLEKSIIAEGCRDALTVWDGTIIDGQNRTLAAKFRGIDSLMCQVFHGLTYEEEARLFVEYNRNRLPLKTVDLVNGLKEAKDADVVRVYNIAHMNGMEISAQCGHNKIAAIRTVISIAKKDGPNALNRALSIIKKTWGGNQDSLKGDIIDGINAFLLAYSNIDEDRLIGKLACVTPKALIADATFDSNGGQKKHRVARQVMRQYNKNARVRLMDKFAV